MVGSPTAARVIAAVAAASPRPPSTSSSCSPLHLSSTNANIGAMDKSFCSHNLFKLLGIMLAMTLVHAPARA